MEERCFSKMVYEAEKSLGFEAGKFQQYFPSIAWGSYNLCQDIDQSSVDFCEIWRKKYQLNQNGDQSSPEEKLKELFEVAAFFFSLLLHLERHCEDYTCNFAQRAPHQFEDWMAERQHNARRQRLRAV